MDNSQLIIPVNLDNPHRVTAETIFRACYPGRELPIGLVGTASMIVDSFVKELWKSIYQILHSAEIQSASTERIRRVLILETWNQFIFDILGENARVVEVRKG